MSVFPELGQQAGQILLDAVSAYNPAGGPGNGPAMQLALGALADSGAVQMIDRGTHVELDSSNLTMPAIVLINWLLENHVDAADRDAVISDMRMYLASYRPLTGPVSVSPSICMLERGR